MLSNFFLPRVVFYEKYHTKSGRHLTETRTKPQPAHRAGSEPSEFKANPLSKTQDFFFPALPKLSPSKLETQTNGLQSEMFRLSEQQPQSELSRVPRHRQFIISWPSDVILKHQFVACLGRGWAGASQGKRVALKPCKAKSQTMRFS